jgi:predicted Zn-dependent protease with MMP-like domain
VQQACDEIPPKFQRVLHNIAVVVEDDPPDEVMAEGGALGLYQGTPIGERGTNYGMLLPDKITIYRRPLLDACHSQAELKDEIRLTVLHEVGHYFGIEDHELPF